MKQANELHHLHAQLRKGHFKKFNSLDINSIIHQNVTSFQKSDIHTIVQVNEDTVRVIYK